MSKPYYVRIYFESNTALFPTMEEDARIFKGAYDDWNSFSGFGKPPQSWIRNDNCTFRFEHIVGIEIFEKVVKPDPHEQMVAAQTKLAETLAKSMGEGESWRE